MTPETIARAGALARWGTMHNAAVTITNHADAQIGRRGVFHAIDEGIRARAYSDRLTELNALAGYEINVDQTPGVLFEDAARNFYLAFHDARLERSLAPPSSEMTLFCDSPERAEKIMAAFGALMDAGKVAFPTGGDRPRGDVACST